MSKKFFPAICVILSTLTLTACLPVISQNIGKDDNAQNANLTNNVLPDNQNPDEVKPETPETTPESTPDSNEKETTGISNNGGTFVGVDGKIYFRQYGNYCLESFSSIRGFLKYGTGGYDSSLCCFPSDDPDNIEVVSIEDHGIGDLYYNDGYIYSTRYDWDMGVANPVLYRTDVSTGESEDFGFGAIRAASEDAAYLATYNYNYNANGQITIKAYEKGKEVCSYVVPEEYGYTIPIAVEKGNIFLTSTYSDDCISKIWQYDYEKGEMYFLCEVNPPEHTDQYLSYPDVRDAHISNENLEFTLCYCVGVTAYVDAAQEVSVPVNDNVDGSIEGALFDPTVKASKKYVDTSDEDFDIPSNLKSLEVDREGDNGFLRAVQTVETVYDKTYSIVANLYYAESWHQAQTGSYNLLSLDYYCFDDANPNPVLFNENNPTDRDLMVRAWFVGKKGSAPEKLLFQYAEINGPEGPFDFDPIFYTAEFSDDFVFAHIPEDGDFYDDMVEDDMAYLVKYLDTDYYNAYLDKLPKHEEFYNYEEPAVDWNDPDSPVYGYLHIKFNREGKINYLRYVMMD